MHACEFLNLNVKHLSESGFILHNYGFYLHCILNDPLEKPTKAIQGEQHPEECKNNEKAKREKEKKPKKEKKEKKGNNYYSAA